MNALCENSKQGDRVVDAHKIFVDTGRKPWDSRKGAAASGLRLQVSLGSAEWVLKKNCLTRLKGSSTRTSLILSASAVQDRRPCPNSRKDRGTFNRSAFWPTFGSALPVTTS